MYIVTDRHKEEFTKVVEPGLDAAKHWPLFIECWYVQTAIIHEVEADSEGWHSVCNKYYQDEMAELIS